MHYQFNFCRKADKHDLHQGLLICAKRYRVLDHCIYGLTELKKPLLDLLNFLNGYFITLWFWHNS
ncbi:MAG: hypothetical protein ACJAQ4_002289 [Cryomorphaceae bacterium]|jgi:hypothetical protein